MRKHIVVAPTWEDHPELEALLAELPDLDQDRITQILKDKPISLVARVQVGATELVIKRYRTPSLGKRLSRLLRLSKAYRSWWACQRLAALGIPAMQAVAFVEQRFGPLRFDPVLIGTLVDGPDMIEYLGQYPMENARWESGAKQIIERVQAIHRAGLVHGDLNWTNIRFTRQGASFVDLDDMRAFRFPPRFHNRMLRDWRVLIYNWRDRPAMQKRFAELMRETLGQGLYQQVTAKSFRDHKPVLPFS
ncbi:hypothetical protein J2T60_002650 [Natronospira proteinivora]|uniref:Lipopolysaccharide kinase (Kdo/WaaP) family protein n=1 Tax=Natronospira proteinivora TaxID=1807133 RepID=A0ABT1GBD6_9GAMM|nr:lipopolysaccharide kinase InaA family protein [Natronospira proteinivora]MCP1728636.1 hypothetical protein [Natronospira proteinivora]